MKRLIRWNDLWQPIAFVTTSLIVFIGLVISSTHLIPLPAYGQAAYNRSLKPLSANAYQHQAMASTEQSEEENVMIILDSSYSMSESISGRGSEEKMDVAKRTMMEVLRNIPPTTRIGFRVYGNSDDVFSSCSATDVLVPLGVNNRRFIVSKLASVHPTGATPISYTIKRSLDEDFRNVSGKKSIILISDGMETCGEDPCNVAVRMQHNGINVKISVVGLGLQDYAATKQLRCIALATKGNYFAANTAAELLNGLNQALAVETKVHGTILSPSGMSHSVVTTP